MKYSGIIIAGGKSSRMGFDKSQIVYQGKTFLQNAIDLLENFCDDILISSNQPLNTKYPVISDTLKAIGPMGGLYACLPEIKHNKAIVIPVDMPLLNKEIIENLIRQDKEQYQICIYKTGERMQSLVGIYHKNTVNLITEQIKNGDYKLQNLLQKSVHKIIDSNKFTHYFKNFNTESDLQQLNKSNG